MIDPASLRKPYYYTREGLPGLDFNREIVPPGTNEAFPAGVVGIRVDDDFWSVAALPYEYVNVPLSEIVRTLWPHYADEAELCPDSGTVEQRIFKLENGLASERRATKHLNRELLKARDELDRLRKDRPDLRERAVKRTEATVNYFVRQYEHLLIATAHEAEPGLTPERRAVCPRCGLLGSDRVHMKYWIERRAEGVDPHFRIGLDYEDDRSRD